MLVLGLIIHNLGCICYCSYVDDAQLYISVKPEEPTSITLMIFHLKCVNYIKKLLQSCHFWLWHIATHCVSQVKFKTIS